VDANRHASGKLQSILGHGEAKINLRWQNDETLVIEHHVAPKNIADIAENCGSVRIVARAVQPYENY
jgi:hypothetical protein